jgi:phospholipid/cholesterol/gamma-HCH transport system substrate-binding protein
MNLSGKQRRRLAEAIKPIAGIVTIVLLAAFVCVSYNSNHGLPFASSYSINADVPNADRLIKTDEVRIAGLRVGQVSSVNARIAPDGQPYAVLGLSLEPAAGPLPINTRIEVEAASILGQTYVALTPGTSQIKVRAGGTLPISDAVSSVDLTDLLDIFHRSTVTAIQNTIGSLSGGVAGRGAQLNEAIYALARLLGPLQQLSRTLAAPQTNLVGFIRGFDAFGRALAPVSHQLAALVGNGSTTLGALASANAAVAATIDDLPGAESSATTALTSLAQPLRSLASLTVRLRAAGELLPGSLRGINATLEAGVRPLIALPPFDIKLQQALAELQSFSRDPATRNSLRKLTSALSAVGPLLAVLTPAQTYCNILGLDFRNFASAWGSLGLGDGPSIIDAGVVTYGAFAEELQAASPAFNLHINYLPTEDRRECASGNEPYSLTSQDLSNPASVPSSTVPQTTPPAGVTALAQKAGLLP